MPTRITTAPSGGFDVAPPNVKLADLLVAGPQSIASLSMVLLIASTHDDFPLANKATRLMHPDSFKTCVQQVVNETYNAYPENDKAFNALQSTLAQVPRLIEHFVATLNEDGSDEIRLLRHNILNIVAKLVAQAVNISEQAENNFNSLLALIQELLVGILATPGGRALHQGDQVPIALTDICPAKTQIYVRRAALKRPEQVPKSISLNWALAGDENGQPGVTVPKRDFWDAAERHPGWRESASKPTSNFLQLSQPHKPQRPPTRRGPTPQIAQYLWNVIDSYQHHAAQVQQITQLLRSAQIVTDPTAPKTFAILLSSGDKPTVQASLDGIQTPGNSQRGIVTQQAKDILATVNAVNRIVTTYVRVSKDYTLPGQRRLCKIPYRDNLSSR